MKKSFIILISVYIVFLLTVIISVSLIRSSLYLRAVDLRNASMFAFYAAETGIERALAQLRRNITWRDGFGSIENDNIIESEIAVWKDSSDFNPVGKYAVIVADGDVLDNWETVWLKAVGQDNEKKATKILLVQVAVKSPADFFTSTLGDLCIGSEAKIEGEVLARNITFDVNSDLSEDERVININDNVFYTGNIKMDEKYLKLNDGAEIKKTTPLTFTSVDLSRYRSVAEAGGEYVKGDFSGTVNDFSPANGVVFVEGDVYLSGRVDESILIVAGGNIYINDDILCSENNQIGLFAHKDVIIPEGAPDNLSVEAFIVADGGMFKAEGEKGSKENFTFKGAISARGSESKEQRTSVDLNVFGSRSYSYNEALLDNRSIPFMPFIATVVRWLEVPFNVPFPPELE